jgi:hypothetical protein
MGTPADPKWAHRLLPIGVMNVTARAECGIGRQKMPQAGGFAADSLIKRMFALVFYIKAPMRRGAEE